MHAEMEVAFLVAISQGCVEGSALFLARVASLRKKQLKKVKSTIKYANKMFFADDAKLRRQMLALRACSLFDPTRIVALQLHVTAAGGWLSELPFMTAQLQARMFLELGVYVAHAQLAAPATTPLGFVKQRKADLPAWREAVHGGVHIKPNSATVERVFGLAGTVFDKSQMSLLNDAAAASLMLRYNNRKPAPQNHRDDDLSGFNAAGIFFPPPPAGAAALETGPTLFGLS